MYDVSADKIYADVDRWITGRNAERDRKILKRRLNVEYPLDNS